MNNKHIKILFFNIIIFTVFFDCTSKEFGKSFFTIRPQGLNSAQKIVGSLYIEQPKQSCDRTYDRFSVITAWQESWDQKALSEFLFFNGTSRMRFGNAGASNVDVFSRNFFLNDDFQGTANIDPIIKNFITHFEISCDLGCWRPGLYASIRSPIIWTFWNLELSEVKPKKGTFIPKQTFGNNFDKSSPLDSIVLAWRGNTINTNSSSTNKDEDFFPDLKQRMHFATIFGAQRDARLGDMELTLGYNVITKMDAHFDIQGRLVIPTGTRPDARFFFEPVAGNGHHVLAGFGITGHDTFLCGEHSALRGYVDGGVYHMFRARQKRTFDLKNNGKGSRYLLFKRFDTQGNYAHEILFGPNVTTLDCTVSADFMSDLSIMLQYTWRGLDVSLGYNAWSRAKEKIKLKDTIPANTFGIQGKTQTAGDTENTTASRTLINGDNATLFDSTTVFISSKDLDIDSSANPIAFSQKLFLYLGYAWLCHPNTPFFGMAIEGEVSVLSNTALAQFGIWAKWGLTF